MNPWFSIWFNPQKTIAVIVDKNPERLVPDIAIIAGISFAFGSAVETHSGDKVGLLAIILLAIIIGSISGWMFLYISSALIHWTGKWLNGKAPIEHIRAALSWANVPMVWSLGIWVIVIAIFQINLFQADTISFENDEFLAIVYLLFLFIWIVLQFWVLVIFLRCLGQVQQFSLWKSLLNLLISALVVYVPLLSIIMIGSYFYQS